MELLHTENHPGVNGEIFEIRIIDHVHSKEVSIDLFINYDNEIRKVNIVRYTLQEPFNLETAKTEALRTASLISIVQREIKSIQP